MPFIGASPAASFKQLYRTRPARLQKSTCNSIWGASDTALAFLDTFRLANHSQLALYVLAGAGFRNSAAFRAIRPRPRAWASCWRAASLL